MAGRYISLVSAARNAKRPRSHGSRRNPIVPTASAPSPPPEGVRERPPERPRDEDAHAEERHDPPRRVGREPALPDEVEREERRDEAREPVHEHPGEERPEHRREAADGGAETIGERRHGASGVAPARRVDHATKDGRPGGRPSRRIGV
jgi:hypothetical protein